MFFSFETSAPGSAEIMLIKGSLEDTSKLRRVEERCDWKGEGNRGDVN